MLDGLLIGATSAAAWLGGKRKALTGGWTPGSSDTATSIVADLAPGLLDRAAEDVDTASQQLAQSYISQLGRILVDGIDAGQDAAEIARQLAETARDARHAGLLMQDQITRAAGHASIAYGQVQGCTMGRWLTEHDAKVCPTCLANAAAGLVPLGEPYPSGDIAPPAHPFGRCAVVPVHDTI